MGIGDDIQINQSYWFSWCQGYGEIYSYNLRERGKSKILFTSETHSVAIISYCRKCIVRFKAVYQSQITGERNDQQRIF